MYQNDVRTQKYCLISHSTNINWTLDKVLGRSRFLWVFYLLVGWLLYSPPFHTLKRPLRHSEELLRWSDLVKSGGGGVVDVVS